MTSSNTSNKHELDGSFAVPTQPINSLSHIHQDGDHLMTLLNSRQEVDGSFAVTTQAKLATRHPQHQPALQPVSNVCQMSNAQSNNSQQRQQRQGSNVTQMCTTWSNKRRRTKGQNSKAADRTCLSW